MTYTALHHQGATKIISSNFHVVHHYYQQGTYQSGCQVACILFAKSTNRGTVPANAALLAVQLIIVSSVMQA